MAISEGCTEGTLPAFGKSDPDEFRAFTCANKSVVKKPKLVTLQEAVSCFVKDGDYVKLGGFGQVRTAMAAIFEIIRQKRRNLTVAGHTTSHDVDVLMAGGCVSRIEVAYSFGHEFRPSRSAVGPRLQKAGALQISEWSNASFAWRLKAAAMGLSFIPARFMLGTDTFRYSGAKQIKCPFTDKTYAALPALYPDVAVIHVPRADKFGNAQIDGMIISDDDAARAARRVILTAEEIVDTEVFAREPDRTVIPYYYTDAVVHAPFGSYPCEMPGHYWFDEFQIADYLRATTNEAALAAYLEKFFFTPKTWQEHLEIAGGESRLETLIDIAKNKVPPPSSSAVWGQS